MSLIFLRLHIQLIYIHVYLIEFVTITYTFRLIHSGQRSNPLTGADLITFGTRCGTRNGVEMHVFRVETQRDLAYWSRALVQGSHGAAVLIKEVTCGMACSTNVWTKTKHVK